MAACCGGGMGCAHFLSFLIFSCSWGTLAAKVSFKDCNKACQREAR